MISIIKGRKECRCNALCGLVIESGAMKIKDSQDNSNRKYYHLGCAPIQMVNRQLQLWTLALQESRQQ
jgi:hypothetical protein